MGREVFSSRVSGEPGRGRCACCAGIILERSDIDGVDVNKVIQGGYRSNQVADAEGKAPRGSVWWLTADQTRTSTTACCYRVFVRVRGIFTIRLTTHPPLSSSSSWENWVLTVPLPLGTSPPLLSHPMAVCPALSQASTLRYVSAINRRFIPAFGSVQLPKLTPQRVQAAYKQWAEEGISSTTLAFYHSVLRKAFAQAVDQRLIVRSPLDSISPPRPRHVEMRDWSFEEARDFLARSTEDEHATVWALALHTGLRKWELLALRWVDIDLRQGYGSVQRTLTRGEHGFVVGDVKTRSGRRRSRLGPGMIAQHRAHRQQQIEQRLRLGPAWQDNDLVFPREDGTQQIPEVVARRFKRLLLRLELSEIRFHDLRHTAATLMLARNARWITRTGPAAEVIPPGGRG